MDLSVIIPALNEEFLQRTINDVLSNAKGDTEVIAILDGYWPNPGIKDHPRVTLIHHENPIGQRAATNEGVKLSQAKYIMKADAHCSFDKGFDVKLMADCEYDWTVIPRMYVLDAFHWVCQDCKKEHHQGPVLKECVSCKSTNIERKIIWKRKKRKRTDYMWFDNTLRMRYFDRIGLGKYGKDVNATKKWCSHKLKDWSKDKITDVMVGIGACWFLHRERYWELGGLDEKHGSWGQMAVEISLKAHLSGGRHVVNKNTWFSHLPRTQTGFSWPYDNPVAAQEKARQYSRDLWLNDKWPQAVHKLDWVLEKYGPLPSWHEKLKNVQSKKLTKGMVYYTDNQCEERLAVAVRQQLLSACNGHKIVSVSQYPLDFGDNITVKDSRSILTMFKQILAGLEKIDTDIVFLTEHDVLYHPSHFDFVPPEKDKFYYNLNFWFLRTKDGQALQYHTQAVSQLCAYRELLLEHYTTRVKRVEKDGFTLRIGYEPGNHPYPRGIDKYTYENWKSEYPNIDFRHGKNISGVRFKKEQFRRKPKDWILADEIPYWGKTKKNFDGFLRKLL